MVNLFFMTVSWILAALLVGASVMLMYAVGDLATQIEAALPDPEPEVDEGLTREELVKICREVAREEKKLKKYDKTMRCYQW